MLEFLAKIAAEAAWAIPVSIALWFIARRLVGSRSDPTVAASELPPTPVAEVPQRPPWQRALLLVGTAALLWGLLVAIGALITGTRSPLRGIDLSVTEWIGNHRTDAATSIAIVTDHVGDTPGVIAVLLMAAAVAHAATRRWTPSLLLIVATAGETSIFLAAQSVISRPRPAIEHLAVEPATSSFPSGHVAASIVTYGCIALLLVAWGRSSVRFAAFALATLLVLAVVWSRLYQGMHYPSDVLASALFAPVWLAACWWAFRAKPASASITDAVDSAARRRTT
jgi:undecaprenyl-diphosphatase